MFFVTFHENTAKYVYLVPEEDLSVIRGQLGSGKPLEFDALNPKNLKATPWRVWIKGGLVHRVVSIEAEDETEESSGESGSPYPI